MLFKSSKKKKKQAVRKVYFGIRVRLLGLLFVVLACIIAVLTLAMYLNQRRMLAAEKNTKAETLVRILSGPAEFYLDQNINTAPEERKLKYDTIVREANSFKNYNEDIVKIVLTDEKGTVRFSTSPGDYRARQAIPYVKASLSLTEERLLGTDFKEEGTGKDRGKTGKFRAITYPIFLHGGIVVDVLRDFNKFYETARGMSKKQRAQVYEALWNKYRNELGDEFDPHAPPADVRPAQKKGARATKPQGAPKAPAGENGRAGSIDLMFMKLFSGIVSVRNRKIPPSERWLWQERWLLNLYAKKERAYENDQAKEAYAIEEQINRNFRLMADRVEGLRRLGVLAVVFDMQKIEDDLNRDISKAAHIALAMTGVSVIVCWILLHFMIQNLKRLERWAVSVGEGNIDTRIEIRTNDEIGRLSDVFNHMIDELTKKFHLEKYVSRSTRALIEAKKGTAGRMELGETGRKSLAFMFSDVRGFTSFSERNDSQTVIEVLNFYLALQSQIIKGGGGDIDDYVGDQIMAHWSGPARVDRAVECALRIMSALAETNAKRREQELPVFEVGIGIHGGEVVVGNIGSDFRMDFACVGDAVNLTSRLCSAAGPGEILASKEILSLANKKFHHRRLDPVSVKGKAEKIEVVRILPG
jgi:class 3 adenylate cyclase